MPIEGLNAKNLKGKTSVANPRDFNLVDGVVRFNPVPRQGGGPAVRQGGHRFGQVTAPTPDRMDPTIPANGGPATRKAGHRFGQVDDVNPQTRFHPLSR